MQDSISEAESSDTNSTISGSNEEEDRHSNPTEDLTDNFAEYCIHVLTDFQSNNMPTKQVTNKELLEAINKNNEQVSQLRNEIGSLTAKLNAALNQIKHLETENGQLKHHLEQNDIKIKKLEEEKAQQTTERQKLEKRQETIEQHSRLNKIVLRGTAFSYNTENIKTTTINTLAETLRLTKEQLKKSDFRVFGKKQQSILMTVCDHNDKLDVFAAVRKVKPNNMSINEFLTPTKANLIYELRKLKYEQEGRFHSVFSLNGNVYVTYTQGGQKKLIENLSEA